MEDFEKFLGKLQKRGSKPHRIQHCLGSRDAFMWVRKNKWEAMDGRICDKLLYSQIIHEVNKELSELLLEGHEIEFPYQMGSLVLNCVPAKVAYKDGKLVNNYKIDWKRTLEYLYTDREALDKHERVKSIRPFIYHVRYYKRKARFPNMRFYSFRTNRSLLRRLWRASEKGKINAEQTEY